MSDRWAAVPEPEALASAGRPARVLPGVSATYAVGPAGTVVVVDAGDRPGGSGVQSVDDLTLRGPFPEEVAAALRTKDGTIIGYARLDSGCVPIGRLRVSTVRAQGEQLLDCHLFLEERLPYDVLDLVRPPVAPDAPPGLDWLERLPAHPIAALDGFLAGWYADVPPAEPDDAGTALPPALAAFYRAAAGRPEVLGGFNRIYPATEVGPDPVSGLMAFGIEGRGGFQLLMDPAEADPPVSYSNLNGGGREPEREPLSGFLVQFALLDAALASPFSAFAACDRAQVDQLAMRLRPVPLRPLRYPNDPTHLYAGPGVVAAVAGAGDDAYELYLGARHRSALRPLRDAGVHWQYFSG